MESVLFKLSATLIFGAVLTGCAATGSQSTRYAANDGEEVIVVAIADRPGGRTFDNAAGLPHQAAPLVGASPGPVGAVVIDVVAGAILNSIGSRIPTLGFRTINEKTCQPVIFRSNLEVDGQAVMLREGEYAQWRRLGETRKLALVPTTPEGEKTRYIRRSHPCFAEWEKEWKTSRTCLECKRALIVWPGTEKPLPKFEWLED